jgi:hypothetical protein
MWLQIDEGFDTHRKTLALCRILGNPEGGMYLLRLWKWACRSSPDGNLTGTEPADLEEIVRFRGAPGAFYAAAVAVGFVDELPGGEKRLHDWADWTGGDLVEMAKEARRKWWARQHAKGSCGGVSGHPDQGPCPICTRDHSDSGGNMSGGPSADRRRTSTVDKTSPGKTRQGKTRSEEGEGTPRGNPARPPSLFDRLLDAFGKAWSVKYEEPYTPTPADRSQLGRLLQALKTPEESAALPALFDAYLRDDDAFVAEKQRHSLAYFCTSGGLNKYRTRPPVSVPRARGRSAAEQREANNAAAAETWLARGGGANGRG